MTKSSGRSRSGEMLKLLATSLVKSPLSSTPGDGIRAEFRVRVDQTDTDQGPARFGETGVAHEALIHAELGLASEVVVHTRENHNQLVAQRQPPC